MVQNVPVSKHAGAHSAPRPARSARTYRPARPAGQPTGGSRSRSRLALLAAGVTVTLIAWGFLVAAAIDFGKEARSGEPTA